MVESCVAATERRQKRLHLSRENIGVAQSDHRRPPIREKCLKLLSCGCVVVPVTDQLLQIIENYCEHLNPSLFAT